MKGTNLAILAILALVGAGVAVAIANPYIFPNNATVKGIGVGVYEDEGCTILIESIDWGFIAVDAQKNEIIYVASESTVDITLALTVGNWNPAGSYATLTWDCEGEALAPDEYIEATLTLSLLSDPGTTNFSFDITITAVEVS